MFIKGKELDFVSRLTRLPDITDTEINEYYSFRIDYLAETVYNLGCSFSNTRSLIIINKQRPIYKFLQSLHAKNIRTPKKIYYDNIFNNVLSGIFMDDIVYEISKFLY